MVVPDDKTRKTFSISKEVVTALVKHIAREVADGKRATAYGAESEIVELALCKYLNIEEEKTNGSDRVCD